MKEKEEVNHPKHYGNKEDPYEVIKVIEAWGLDKNFCLGNVVKYIARHKKKGNPSQDLRKALWYLTHEVKHVTKLDKNNALKEQAQETLKETIIFRQPRLSSKAKEYIQHNVDPVNGSFKVPQYEVSTVVEKLKAENFIKSDLNFLNDLVRFGISLIEF